MAYFAQCFHLDRQKIIQADVANLLEVEFIYEVEYPDWQTNVVLPNNGGK